MPHGAMKYKDIKKSIFEHLLDFVIFSPPPTHPVVETVTSLSMHALLSLHYMEHMLSNKCRGTKFPGQPKDAAEYLSWTGIQSLTAMEHGKGLSWHKMT